jgi:hypothetical protein
VHAYTHAFTLADPLARAHTVYQFKCYIVATCDRELKRRIRKIPGVPIMYVANHKYAIERLPDAVAGTHKGQTQCETESDLDAVGKQSACVCVCLCVCLSLSLSLCGCVCA